MQIILVTAFLLVTFALSLWVILRPSVAPDKPGIGAVTALVAALIMGHTDVWSPPHWTMLPLILAAVALIPAVTIARSFGRVDMVAVLFHKDFGMQGASLGSLKNQIAAAVLSALFLLLSAYGLAGYLNLNAVLPPIVTVLLLLANPFLRHGLRRLWASPAACTHPLRPVPPQLLTDKTPQPDLVILYLEGLDRRFADAAAFGQVYRKLADFAAEGISFTRVGQIAGTGWSLAGMVATQSGVPITPRGLHFHDRTEDVQAFMPDIPFLGDILASKGYASHYVVGGATEFGGIGAMYRTHQITTLTGYAEMQAHYPPATIKAAKVDWFLDDQLVLNTARTIHRDLVAAPAPYALIVETIGPHGPKGYLSRRWTNSGCAEKTGSIAFAAECLIAEVMEFLADVRRVQASTGRALRVVLMSDHLNHVTRLPKAGADYAGYNTVIFWGDAGRQAVEIEKPGSMVDVFPTLLDWLGWSAAPVAAGLGRSLLSDPPTLVEEFGVKGVDARIVGDAGLSNQLWGPAPHLAEKPAAA